MQKNKHFGKLYAKKFGIKKIKHYLCTALREMLINKLLGSLGEWLKPAVC